MRRSIERCTGFCARVARALTCGVALLPLAVDAQLRIEITSGVSDPIPVAVVPFAGAGAPDLAAVVQADLERSGRIRTLPREQLPALPSRAADVDLERWRATRSDYVLVGALRKADGDQWAATVSLVNLANGQTLLQETLLGTSANDRMLAHRIADLVYLKVLGIPGAFATRIAYVSVDGRPPQQSFQLIVADADGENARVVLQSPQPIMSPSWSPDGRWLAYVSFEAGVAAVYAQRLATGERRKLSARAGVNGAPAWSPDGRRLLLTLSDRSGNLDLYVLDLETQQATRLTDDPAIDTEGAWAPDGRTVYFTSDRAGAPQIYRLEIGSGARPRRVTFGSAYNARPRVSPDGRLLAMVTLDNGAYRIGILDLQTNASRIVSAGRLDESPSFAANGATLIYAGRERGQATLATVSTDGLIHQRLKADRGEVREPAFSPFLR